MVRPRPDERRSGEYCARLMRGAAVAEESFGTRARYWQARMDQGGKCVLNCNSSAYGNPPTCLMRGGGVESFRTSAVLPWP